mgnify:FL=1
MLVALVGAQGGFGGDDGVSVQSWGIVIMVGLFVIVVAAVVVPTILRLRVRSARMIRIDREVEIGAVGGDAWNPRQLKVPVRAAFLPVQDAWSRGDLDRAGVYLTDGQRRRLEAELADRAERGRANHVEDVVLDEVTILRVDGAPGEDPDGFVAYVAWRARDWTEDTGTGRVIEGKPARLRRFAQLWTFRRDDERGWLIAALDDASAAERIANQQTTEGV